VNDRLRLEAGLDAAAPFVIAACVLAAALASSIRDDFDSVGRPARWLLIGLLLAFAVARASLCGPDWRFPRATAAAIGVFCGLGLVSIAWSVHPRGTLERAVGEVVVLGALGLLAGCVASRPSLAEGMLDGVLAAAAVVALAGFVYWLVEPSSASIAATTEYPSRYQGIEQNPNTAALLLAIGMPLAFRRALAAQTAAPRVAFVLLAAAFAASISAAGSRGALGAGFLALLVVVALAPLRGRVRAGLAALVVAGLVVSAWAMTIPKALPPTAAAAPAVQSDVASRREGVDAERYLPLGQEIGNPWWTHRAGTSRRSLFNTSVRLRALRGSVRLAAGRPVLGYGFGAEQWAFFNRYYAFNSGNPENGYAGIFLQIGVVGLALFLSVLALCFVPGVRACLRAARAGVPLAAVGAAAAGLLLGVSQSFFHGPGGIAYVAFWTSLLVTAVSGMRVQRA
jgi:O-antigen ligase